MALIECVPNVSEGRHGGVIRALVEAIAAVPDAHLLDCSSDASHNRSVFTLAGEAEPLQRAVLALVERAVALIDLRTHRGGHPRIGAVDVVPFVPLADATLADCAALARTTAARVAEQFQVPVYLYEEAASSPSRRRLEDIRRGGFEGLARKMALPEWRPDFGPIVPHPTAGATVIGARPILIAYNVNLDTDRIEIAARIAATIRSSSGGLPHVKAMAVRLEDRGIVQVSMNLTNFKETSIVQVFDAIRQEAAAEGIAVLGSEIVGLVPADAIADVPSDYLKLSPWDRDRILEQRLSAR